MTINVKKQRLQMTIQRILSQIFQKDIKDLILRNLSIIEVKLNLDASIAKVYYSYLVTNPDLNAVTVAIQKNLWLIRKKLSQKLKVYQVPQLEFINDTLINQSEKINKILEKIKEDTNKT